jgi:acetyl esterase/lipase
VANSLNYAAALRKAGVPFALHVFPFGSHGLGLAPDRPDIARWPELCSDFLHRLGW